MLLMGLHCENKTSQHVEKTGSYQWTFWNDSTYFSGPKALSKMLSPPKFHEQQKKCQVPFT